MLKENFGKHSVEKSAYEALLPFMPDFSCSWGPKVSTININGVSVPCIRMSFDYNHDLITGLEQQGFEEADLDYTLQPIIQRIIQADDEIEFYSRGDLIVSIQLMPFNAFEDPNIVFLIEQF